MAKLRKQKEQKDNESGNLWITDFLETLTNISDKKCLDNGPSQEWYIIMKNFQRKRQNKKCSTKNFRENRTKTTEKEQLQGIDNIDMSNEKEDMDMLIRYSGKGPKKNNKGEAQLTDKNIKAVYSGVCAIDSIVNFTRSLGYLETIKSHKMCHHTRRCGKCIIRSAICKAENATGIKGRGVKKHVEMPEIISNMQLFLGSHYCGKCKIRFETEDDEREHKKTTIFHKTENIVLIKALKTFLEKTELKNHTHLGLMCTECREDINLDKNGYVVLKEKNKTIEAAINQKLCDMIDNHHNTQERCSIASCDIIYPEVLLMMMSLETVNQFNGSIIVQNQIFDLVGQISYKSEHFYTRIKLDGNFYKIDEKNCVRKEQFSANPNYVMVSAYKKRNIKKDKKNDYCTTISDEYVYSSKSIKFFRQGTDEFKKKAADSRRQRYADNPEKEKKSRTEI